MRDRDVAAASGARDGYADTICDRLLTTVTPAPMPSIMAVKNNQKSTRNGSFSGLNPSSAALFAACDRGSTLAIS